MNKIVIKNWYSNSDKKLHISVSVNGVDQMLRGSTIEESDQLRVLSYRLAKLANLRVSPFNVDNCVGWQISGELYFDPYINIVEEILACVKGLS